MGRRSTANILRNFSSCFPPNPVSTRMFFPWARISRQFSASSIRFWSSAGPQRSQVPRVVRSTPSLSVPHTPTAHTLRARTM